MTWTRPQRDLPSVSKYVKDFTLHVNGDTDYDDDIDYDEISQKFGRSKFFPALLSALHGPDYGIQSLSILVEEDEFIWTGMNKGIQQALLDLFRSPRLRRLKLRNFCLLPFSFLNGMKIKELFLHGCRATRALGTSSSIPGAGLTSGPLPELEILDMDQEFPISCFERGRSAVVDSAICNLRCLAFSVYTSYDFKKCSEIVAKASNTLQRIDIVYYALEAPLEPESGFNLSGVRHLRHIRLLRHYDLEFPQLPDPALQDFVSFLDKTMFPLSGSLETLEFVIAVRGDKEGLIQSFIASWDFDSWSNFDSCLARVCSGDNGLNLKTLIISFRIEKVTQEKLPHGGSALAFAAYAESLVKGSLPFSSSYGNFKSKNFELKINFDFPTQIACE